VKIAVVGAGGTGGYYGALLARQNHDVVFLARGRHLEAIRQDGLRIKSVLGDFHIVAATATDRAAEVGPVDLLLFCAKTYDTDQAAEGALALIGRETTVLSLQNGVEAPERIGTILGMEHMIAGATWVSSAIEAPGVIKHVSQYQRVVLGELNGQATRRAESIAAAFNQAGITTDISPNVQSVLWSKFIFIAAVSGMGCLTRLPIGSWRSVPETRALANRMMHETEQLARASGVNLDSDAIDKATGFVDGTAPHIKPSMQLDVEAGHRSELESLVGFIPRKGRLLGLATPVADMVYACLLPGELRAQTL
jgi:2-dehydropantoate 2-reductase